MKGRTGEEENWGLEDLGTKGLDSKTARQHDTKTVRQLFSDQFMMSEMDFHINLHLMCPFTCDLIKIFGVVCKDYCP